MLPEEPGVSPRSNSERPRRQISSRTFVSVMAASLFSALSHALAARPSRDTQRQRRTKGVGQEEIAGELPHA
jgi:hypothetical protein